MRTLIIFAASAALSSGAWGYTSYDRYQENANYCDKGSDITLDTIGTRDALVDYEDLLDFDKNAAARQKIYGIIKKRHKGFMGDSSFEFFFGEGWRSNADRPTDKALRVYEDCMEQRE